MSMGPSDNLFLYIITRAVFLLIVLLAGELLFYLWSLIEICLIGKVAIGTVLGIGFAGFVKTFAEDLLE